MKTRRHVLILINIFVLPLLLFHFQNCAPVSSASNTTSDTSGVRLVEDLNKAQIQFVAPQVEVQDDAPQTGVDGLCNRDHDGALLHWSISADAQAPMLSGQSSCGRGQFSVNVDQLDQLTCGVSYLLVVEGDWGASTFTRVMRRCQPLASEAMAAPQDSPVGTSCSLEYHPASEAQNPCVQVCYRDSKVVMTQALDVGQCSSLARGLAAQ